MKYSILILIALCGCSSAPAGVDALAWDECRLNAVEEADQQAGLLSLVIGGGSIASRALPSDNPLSETAVKKRAEECMRDRGYAR